MPCKKITHLSQKCHVFQITAVSCNYHPSVTTSTVCLNITRLSQHHPSVAISPVCLSITRLSQYNPSVANITHLSQLSPVPVYRKYHPSVSNIFRLSQCILSVKKYLSSILCVIDSIGRGSSHNIEAGPWFSKSVPCTQHSWTKKIFHQSPGRRLR